MKTIEFLAKNLFRTNGIESTKRKVRELKGYTSKSFPFNIYLEKEKMSIQPDAGMTIVTAD